MTQALANIDFNALQALMSPEEIQTLNDKFAAGITGGTFLPELKYRGNKWRLKIDGEEKILPSMNPEVPDTVLVHLVDARPCVSKTFYASGYTQGSDAKPDCSSLDGQVPDSHIENPVSENCMTCPNNAWGSKISEGGGQGKACGDHKQLVVAFNGRPDKAFALRVPAASLKAYKAYVNQLNFNKVPAVAAITQIQLDPETTYPNFLFSCVGIVDSREQFLALTELANTDDVKQVVQIQPRAEKPAELPTHTGAEQPVVAPTVQTSSTSATPSLQELLKGNETKKEVLEEKDHR